VTIHLILTEKAHVSKLTNNVSSGTLNPTYSPTHSITKKLTTQVDFSAYLKVTYQTPLFSTVDFGL